MANTIKSDENDQVSAVMFVGGTIISKLGNKTTLSLDGFNHRITDLEPEETEALFAQPQNPFEGIQDYVDRWFGGKTQGKTTDWLKISAYVVVGTLLAINGAIYAFGG